MKNVLIGLMLLASLPTFAQNKAPDLLIVPQGTLMRAKPTEFLVFLDKTVTDLGYASIRLSSPSSFANLATGKCCEYYPTLMVAEKDQWLVSPGILSLSVISDWSSPVAITKSDSGPFFASNGSIPSEATFKSTFKPSLDGPGELATFTAYSTPTYQGFTKAIYGTSQRDGFYTAEFRDSENFKMFLSVSSAPVSYDFRLFGDLNRDNTFNLLDVSLLLRAVTKTIVLNEAETWYADLAPASKDGQPLKNGRYLGDGRIDISDVTQALRVITGYWKFWWPDPR
jgi:hypothetical protein